MNKNQPGGKGDARRPQQVSAKEAALRWEIVNEWDPEKKQKLIKQLEELQNV